MDRTDLKKWFHRMKQNKHPAFDILSSIINTQYSFPTLKKFSLPLHHSYTLSTD